MIIDALKRTAAAILILLMASPGAFAENPTILEIATKVASEIQPEQEIRQTHFWSKGAIGGGVASFGLLLSMLYSEWGEMYEYDVEEPDYDYLNDYGRRQVVGTRTVTETAGRTYPPGAIPGTRRISDSGWMYVALLGGVGSILIARSRMPCEVWRQTNEDPPQSWLEQRCDVPLRPYNRRPPPRETSARPTFRPLASVNQDSFSVGGNIGW